MINRLLGSMHEVRFPRNDSRFKVSWYLGEKQAFSAHVTLSLRPVSCLSVIQLEGSQECFLTTELQPLSLEVCC